MTGEMSNVDMLVKQWDDYLETDRSFLVGFLLAQQMRDRIEALTARAEAAEADAARLRGALQTIVDSYEATSELHTSVADCAANLYDHARAALKGEQK